MPLVVGVDVATAEVRALATGADGRPRALARRPLPAPTSPQPGWVEQDGRSWWPAVAGALAELAARLGSAAAAVQALSVCSTSGTVVALDERGDPLGPALMYSDQRAEEEAARARQAGAARWAQLGLRVQPAFGLPKWAWLVAREGGAVARLAHVSDVVVGHLTGRPAPSDWSHSLKSGYDPERFEWAAEAVTALGIPLDALPEVRRPTEVAGPVCAAAAGATGLPAGCPVRLGMTDACASQLAAGAGAPGRFVSVLGSTLVLKGASPGLVADPLGAVYSHRHPDGWWLPGGASNTGAAALTAGFHARDLRHLDELAADHGPAGGVTYPLVGRGERFPFVAAGAEAFHAGDLPDEVARYRATLEGVAFVERLGFERLAALGARADPPIFVAGGGSASRAWNRIRASVLDSPLLEAPAATTALGACILAAAGTLHPDLAAATAAMAAAGERVEPVPEERDALARNYERFVGELEVRGWLPPAPEGRPAPPSGGL